MKHRVGVIMVAAIPWLTLTGCATQPAQSPANVAASNEFDIRVAKTQFANKAPADILQALGSPDHQTGNDKWEWWTYENRFHDSLTRKNLTAVTFVFHNGKFDDVTY